MEDFDSLGEFATCYATLVNNLEKFVCCMYVEANFTSVNKLRYDMFSQNYQCTSSQVLSSFDGIDLSPLLPFRASLEMHVVQTIRRSYGVMLMNSFQTYQALKDMTGKRINRLQMDK